MLSGSGRSDIVLFPLGDAALSHVFAHVINACSAALNRQGFTLASDATMYPSPAQAADAWLRLGPAAFIDLILPADHEGVVRLSRAGVARVTTDIDVPGHLSAMDIISVEARKLQLSHVIERGATDIVYAAPSSYYESPKSPLLRPVLESVASDAGVRLAFDTVEATPESVRASARRWAGAGCDAVCGYSDDFALPILTALIDLGVDVPGAMLVIGVDDIPASRASTPSLSSVTAEVEQLGESLAASVQAAVLDPTTPARYAAPELLVIERGSSSRPPLRGRADRPQFTYEISGAVSEAVARAARERSEQEREAQPLTARRSPPIRAAPKTDPRRLDGPARR